MEAKRTRWLGLALALGAGLGLLVLILPGGQARAGDPGGGRAQNVFAQTAAAGGVSMLAAPSPFDGGILDISGSSVETTDCYQAGKSQQILCFTVYNASTDAEWLDRVRLTVPHNPPAWWSVSCSSQDATDSMGNPANLTCGNSFPYEVLYTDNDTETPDSIGEISAGSSWGFCVSVTVPSGYTGPRPFYWGLSGDEDGDPPHEITDGETMVDMCTPLTLIPSQVVITGCNGMAQSLEFELANYGAGNTDVVFVYDAPDANFGGPTGMYIQQGGVITFTAQFEPKLCLEPGETVTGTLAVVSGIYVDESFITQSIAENAGWRRRDDSPIPSMDNAVIWANHGDGGLWSVGGYGSGGAAQRYDPASGVWITYTNPLTPLIEYPMDGCYGMDGDHEIIVLFPDTIVTGELQIFDITAKGWYTKPVPAGYPAEGRWGQDIVSMLQHTGENVCYLSGGATRPGGGETRDLWKYDLEDDVASFVDPGFPAAVWFNFHASWYVPWVGPNGAICVAGGVDHNNQVNSTTQCYDIGNGTFNGLNADLGTLPEPWWGMADGWQVYDGHYQVWIANGVAQNGTLLPASAYIQEGMSNFAYGPPIPHSLYRLEGDGRDGQFYTLNGARGSFWSSEFTLHLAPCPVCHQVDLPFVLRNN